MLSLWKVRRLADSYVGPRPWAPIPPEQPSDVVIAAKLKMIGFGWEQVRVAMIDGFVGPDGWFEVIWNGVTIRFPTKAIN